MRWLLTGIYFIHPLKRYRARKAFLRGHRYSCDLEKYLTDFSKTDDLVYSEEFLVKQLRRDFGVGWLSNDQDEWSFFADAPYFFALMHGQVMLAGIGFKILGKSIFVVQIQAARSSKKSLLDPFRWERMLLRLLIDWAKENGFSQVLIQPADQNEYFINGTDNDRNKRLKMRYDVTARRSGFKLDPNLNAYSLPLSPQA